MPEPEPDGAFPHLIRAALAIILTLTLPVVLYVDIGGDAQTVQVYLDALAAVIAFYFGASSSPR